LSAVPQTWITALTDPSDPTRGPAPALSSPRPGESTGPPWRLIALIALIGVALRGLLAWAAMPLDIQSDEANYIYAALGLERFGLYVDQHRYFWPPGYPWLLSVFLDPESGLAGLNSLRAFQVALTSVIGVTTMLFAWRLFSTRAALFAGALWAVYLPLGAYSHFLWTETVFLSLFLPALWHLLIGMDRASHDSSRSATQRLLLSGLLFGLALYVKELPLFLLPLASLLIIWRAVAESAGPVEGVRRALLVPLAALVVILPWTLRNQEVYGRTIFGGATLGENVYVGLNARYFNFDTLPLRKVRAERGLPPIESFQRKGFTSPPAGWTPTDVNADGVIDARDAAWERAEEVPHAIDRHGVQTRRGLDYALANPIWTLRTRIKKWSDLVAPVSFFTRHQALGRYPADGALGGALRVPSIVGAAFLSGLVMLLGLAGFFFTLQRGPARQLLTLVFGYVALTSTLVAMSRFRVPVEPFFLVLTAGFLAHGWADRGHARMSALRIAGFAACVAILLGLWWVSWPETVMQLRMGMDGAGGHL
jgi:succinate dehydrogenase hydrophobic anchor subunit